MKIKTVNKFLLVFFLILTVSCKKEESESIYKPTPYNLDVPQVFADRILPPLIPSDNTLTNEGVQLGRKLFYDPILSGDGTQSCADCHKQSNAFADNLRFSVGIDGIEGTITSMPIFNAAWNFGEQFFWDGRAINLEDQALQPVTNPIEMHNTWEKAVSDLQNHAEYPELFQNAFKTDVITKELVAKAIAQFERILVSANSRFDKHLLNEIILTEDELEGFNIFMDETKGDCFHCHGSDMNPIWSDNSFHNNGLDADVLNTGLGVITGNPADYGKFKSPSLRNLSFTAPYMHDGRFETLDEVINHYSEGLVFSPTIDPLMKKVNEGGVHLTADEKAKLKAFLVSLSDNDFITNPDFQAP